jgi:DNA-binding MarR family transcriptional regulator
LIDRMVERGAVRREHTGADRREVLVRLTRHGEALLRGLSVAHHAELETAGPLLAKALKAAVRRPRRVA